jgi:[ribosomal protein S5]-alanine N-acetyltransferase
MFKIETDRLFMREWNADDAQILFDMNDDPLVVRYTGDRAFTSLDDARELIRTYDHYQLYGHGRWLCTLKSSGEIVGWCGLKRIDEDGDNFVDLGYRFFKKHWGKGYATESSFASLKFGFEKIGCEEIVARAVKENEASIHVIRKLGFSFWKGAGCHGLPAEYYRLRREDFNKLVGSDSYPYSVAFE